MVGLDTETRDMVITTLQEYAERKLKPELKDCVFALITGNTSPTFAANSTVQASSLFTASDPDGNGTIVRYTLQDASPGSDGGYLMLNGTRISGDSITVTASELSSVAYRTGPSAGSNALLITAYDSAGASATFTPTINVTVFTNNATPTRSSSEIFAAAAADGTLEGV